MKVTTRLLLLPIMCVCAFGQELPKVVVLSTGGTIASKQDPVKGGYVPALSGEDLVAAIPAIKKIAQIQVEDFQYSKPRYDTRDLASPSGESE